jgi:hypothetical protein
MTARAGYRCGLFIVRCVIRSQKMTDAPPFSCSCPVIALLFAAAASKKARKYGVICAAACIFPVIYREPLLGCRADGPLAWQKRQGSALFRRFPLYVARSAALSAARRAGS